MLDCVGKELNIGDKVVCSDMRYADLLIGEIVGFIPKKARVQYRRSEYGEAYGVKGQKEQLKEPYQIFKYEDVVRCKDCKHYRNHPNGMCFAWTEPYDNGRGYKGEEHCVEPDDFCSYGERKNDGQ